MPAKYAVSVVLLEKKFATFELASQYVTAVLVQNPDAVIDIANDRGAV
jgi:hypothetical protein